MRYSRCVSVALVVAAFPLATEAQGPPAKEPVAEGRDPIREVEELRHEVQELREEVRALKEALQGRPTPPTAAQSEQQKQLEAEIRAAMPEATPGAPAVTPGQAAPAPVIQAATGPAAGRSSSILNPDISFNGDFTFLGTDNNQLNKANSFSFREAEIGFQAPIDPFARADAFITFPESETPEVEEAYATFLTLPFNLQARVGKFRVSFGKNNLLHLHALPQTDRPFAEAENFGEDGLSGTGVGVSYLVPNPWDQYVLLTGEVINGLGQPPEGNQGAPLQQPAASRVFRDFTYLGHVQSFFDLNANNNIELGGSALFSLPQSGTQTKVYGVDLTYRWRPLEQAGYHQFTWRSEGYFTQDEVPASSAEEPSAAGTFNTAGFYTYGEYRATQRLWLGTRWDWTQIPAERDQTEWGVYPYFTFAPTEFGYFRLGYQYAWSTRLQQRHANNVWLQYDFSIGPHAAHPF